MKKHEIQMFIKQAETMQFQDLTWKCLPEHIVKAILKDYKE